MNDDLLEPWMARLERWVRLHPVAGSAGLAAVADDIEAVLRARGLNVARHPHRGGDLLVATGSSHPHALGIYGHYDVEPGGRPELTSDSKRVYGRGVADNLGPLALRLAVLERFPKAALDLLWVIEPGEEHGSPALAHWISTIGAPRAALWLDETGYFDPDGTQRVLLLDADVHALDVQRRCARLASDVGRATRVEPRRLRRVVPASGFSVDRLFHGMPYLAIGPNDDRSDVHGDSESLPLDTVDLSGRQFHAVLEGCAGREAPS